MKKNEIPGPSASGQLAPLLDSTDQQVRIAAYEALRRYSHPAIKSRRFMSSADPTQVNFTLDIVRSTGRPLIYVKRTREPRIAVFGRTMPISTPMFYSHPEDFVTLNALDQTGEISVFCRDRHSKRYSDPFHVPARVIELVESLAQRPAPDQTGEMRGLGLPYSLVVQVLDSLQSHGNIPAVLAIEQMSLADLLGPAQRPERPETDEPPRWQNTNPTIRPAPKDAERGELD